MIPTWYAALFMSCQAVLTPLLASEYDELARIPSTNVWSPVQSTSHGPDHGCQSADGRYVSSNASSYAERQVPPDDVRAC